MENFSNNSANSILQMKDLYFSKLEFAQNKSINNTEQSDLTVKYHIEIKGIADDINAREIVVSVSLDDASKRITAQVIANGLFSIQSSNMTEKEKENIFKYNAVAIMFPFVRSQISILTTQPGITPILLQPIDVFAMWDKN